jgi:ribosomal protein S18 acetylase RimI-like enzyme
MRVLQIHPLSETHLSGAARLLEERHARHRAVEALLPEGGDFRAQIERALSADGAAGAVALVDGDVAAYLIGAPQDDGSSEVGLAGCAAREPELIRDLYEHLGSDWVAAGLDRHRIYVPATDAGLVDAWFRLAFGLQFTYAVRETFPESPVDAAVEIREGRASDLDAVAALERAFSEHLRAAPSFSGRAVASDEEVQADWAATWDDERFTHFVAERDSLVVGHVLLYRRKQGDLRIPERSIDLALATTHSDVRGSGAGRALMAHAMRWAHESGYRAMTIDWRVVNLLADRFFTARGFRPTFFRLYRHLP